MIKTLINQRPKYLKCFKAGKKPQRTPMRRGAFLNTNIFNLKVDENMKKHSCSQPEAIEITRKAHPDIYKELIKEAKQHYRSKKNDKN